MTKNSYWPQIQRLMVILKLDKFWGAPNIITLQQRSECCSMKYSWIIVQILRHHMPTITTQSCLVNVARIGGNSVYWSMEVKCNLLCTYSTSNFVSPIIRKQRTKHQDICIIIMLRAYCTANRSCYKFTFITIILWDETQLNAKAGKCVYGSHITIPGAIVQTSQVQPSPLRSRAPRSKPGIATI